MPSSQPSGADHTDPLHELLQQAGTGDREALDAVFPLVYGELKQLARGRLRAEDDGHTLDTTGLVHEAYLRIAGRHVDGKDRAWLLAVASTAMRRVLIDYARRHRAEKRGGSRRPVPLDRVDLPIEERAEALLALDAALDRLAVHDQRRCRVVECRFFAGLTEAETAVALGVGLRTVKRDWAKAKGWLYREVYGA